MKDDHNISRLDHMINGHLKPAYNVHVSFKSQSVIHYSLHQTTNDLNIFKSHLETLEKLYDFLPAQLTPDAGYGSEENYDLMEEKNLKSS